MSRALNLCREDGVHACGVRDDRRAGCATAPFHERRAGSCESLLPERARQVRIFVVSVLEHGLQYQISY